MAVSGILCKRLRGVIYASGFRSKNKAASLIPPEPPVAVAIPPERRAERKGAPLFARRSEPLRASTVLASHRNPGGRLRWDERILLVGSEWVFLLPDAGLPDPLTRV